MKIWIARLASLIFLLLCITMTLYVWSGGAETDLIVWSTLEINSLIIFLNVFKDDKDDDDYIEF